MRVVSNCVMRESLTVNKRVMKKYKTGKHAACDSGVETSEDEAAPVVIDVDAVARPVFTAAIPESQFL